MLRCSTTKKESLTLTTWLGGGIHSSISIPGTWSVLSAWSRGSPQREWQQKEPQTAYVASESSGPRNRPRPFAPGLVISDRRIGGPWGYICHYR